MKQDMILSNQQQNKPIIESYDSMGVLKILCRQKIYVYIDVSPFAYNKIINFLNYKAYGKIWKLLKTYSNTEIAMLYKT